MKFVWIMYAKSGVRARFFYSCALNMAACNEDCDACSAYAGESISSLHEHGKLTEKPSEDIEDVNTVPRSLWTHDLTVTRLKTIISQLLSNGYKRTPGFTELVDSLRDHILLPASFFFLFCFLTNLDICLCARANELFV